MSTFDRYAYTVAYVIQDVWKQQSTEHPIHGFYHGNSQRKVENLLQKGLIARQSNGALFVTPLGMAWISEGCQTKGNGAIIMPQ